jgi:hypothetical protein
VFSTKAEPTRPLLTLGSRSSALDQRYFGQHRDLQPEAIARQLGGELVWKSTDDQGQWIGLIRFNRQFEAALRQDRIPAAPERFCGKSLPGLCGYSR